jgi:Xaa-Pro aminopeptidase/protein-tyrosine-phosphatase
MKIRPATDMAQTTVKKFGLSLEDHQSQPVTNDLIAWAEVIWTMTESHVVELVYRFSKAKKKVDRLNPFADIEAPDNDRFPTAEIYDLTFHQIEASLKFRIDSLSLDEDAYNLRFLPPLELQNRLEKARSLMKESEIDTLVLTTETNFFYFTALKTQFWQSPTRPMFLIITQSNLHPTPIAVVPSIMEECIREKTWLDDIRTWVAPCPHDDGVSTLTTTLIEVTPSGGKVGFMMGHETHIRAPLADILRVKQTLKEENITFVDGTRIMRESRMVKSPYEISCIKQAARIASASFCALPARINQLRREGGEMTERTVRKQMHLLMLEYGADTMPYVMCQSGLGGYTNIVMDPTDQVLKDGDVVVIDTGAKFENYWCDFNRNFVVGVPLDPASAVAETHDILWRATEAGFAAAVEGNTTSDIFYAMLAVIPTDGKFDEKDFSTGRMGHGLGLELTELFSNKPGDDTPLRAGMVVTLEPSMPIVGSSDGKMLVHEEDIVVSPNGGVPVWLSHRAPRTMPVVGSLTRIVINTITPTLHFLDNFSTNTA